MTQLWLLVSVPISLWLAWLEAPPTLVFSAALMAIIPLVGLIGDATERLAAKRGSVAGGLINSTLSNLPELIIGGVALANGLHRVVKASLTGAILANLLVSLGVALIAGGLRHGEQTIDRRRLRVSASMLLICAFCFIVPAVFSLGAPQLSRGLSLEMSVVLLGIYCLNLVVTLFSGGAGMGLVTEEHAVDAHPAGSSWNELAVLGAAAALLAMVSEILSDALVPTAKQLGLSDTFSGIVLLGGIGSLGEIIASARFARKGQPSLVLSATVGSTIQLVLLVAPLLVFAGRLLGQPMDLRFTSFEVVAIVLATLITREIIEDGKANWFEGFLLLGVYVILAIGFFHLPG
ncbi:MAG: calcium/proton exchanger [Planctomycetota bacterium]|nr:MAG: calcium/proton exchanger [Planctomycetota bacterium]